MADFIAELKYNSTEDGGRSTPAYSGYRPAIKFPFDSMQTSGQQIFIDRNIVTPGETVKAQINIYSPLYFEGRLSPGDIFDFREGAKVIGSGKILEVVNQALLKK